MDDMSLAHVSNSALLCLHHRDTRTCLLGARSGSWSFGPLDDEMIKRLTYLAAIVPRQYTPARASSPPPQISTPCSSGSQLFSRRTCTSIHAASLSKSFQKVISLYNGDVERKLSLGASKLLSTHVTLTHFHSHRSPRPFPLMKKYAKKMNASMLCPIAAPHQGDLRIYRSAMEPLFMSMRRRAV